jgi:hypothetical protein
MSLLVSGVFGNKMEILAADDKSSVHFGGNDFAGQNSASNRNHSSEGAFLVCQDSESVMDHSSKAQEPVQSKLLGSPSITTAILLIRRGVVPIYDPVIASFGVLKPRPMSLYHRRPPFPIFLLFAGFDL